MDIACLPFVWQCLPHWKHHFHPDPVQGKLLLVPTVCGGVQQSSPQAASQRKDDLHSTAHLRFRKCILSVGHFVLLGPRLITAVSLALWTRTSGHWENKAQTFFHPDSYYIIFSEDAAKKEILLCLQSVLPFKGKDSKTTTTKKLKKKNSAYPARYLYFWNTIFIFGTAEDGWILQLSNPRVL